MHIVIGHKVLNLEELYNVSYLDFTGSEVIVDNQLHADLSTKDAGNAAPKPFAASGLGPLFRPQLRAVLLVKIVQILKLKKIAQRSTIDFLVDALNSNYAWESEKVDNGVDFFEWLSDLCAAKNVAFNDKEHYVMSAPVHVPQAILAVTAYRLRESLGFRDTVLAISSELLAVHIDNFTDYALTLGKATQGLNTFKNNLLALVDKSKLLGNSAPKDVNGLDLPGAFHVHGSLHEQCAYLCQHLANDLNSDFAALYQEKKYKELQAIASASQSNLLEQAKNQFAPFVQNLKKSHKSSQVRKALLESKLSGEKSELTEEAEAVAADFPLKDLISFIAQSQQVMNAAFVEELHVAFSFATKQEDAKKAKLEAKQKKDEDKGDGKGKKPNNKKAKDAGKDSAQIAFGKGSRAFFEFLTASKILDADESKRALLFDVAFNKEMQSVLGEILQVRNEERRKPKCAKGTRDMTPLQMAIREKAFDVIRGVFKRHGASEIDTPVFELKETLTGKYGEDSKLIYDLEDQGGELLALRYDLTVPFARYVAANNIASIKRYHIAKVYRRDQPQMTKGRFREFYQCDFDIAGQYSPMIPDAEVLSVVAQILSGLNIGNFIVKLNHRKFLDAMVELAGCEKRKFKTICSSIDKLDKEPWEKVRQELIEQKGLTVEMTDKLHKFVQFQGKPWELLQRLKDEAVFEGHESGTETIAEMELLFGYLEAMGDLVHFSFDFSLARGLDYYTGLIYEAVFTDSDRVGSIAGGGRYDGLVGMFSGKNIPAIGVSIGIERVFAILEEKEKAAANVRATSTQVMVAQIGKNLTVERMKVLGELWRNGIAAETLYNDNPKVPKQIQYALDTGIPLILWLGEEEVAEGIAKVKSLNDHEEFKIERSDLIPRIKELIAANPVLLSQEEQEVNLKKKQAADAEKKAEDVEIKDDEKAAEEEKKE